MKKITCMLIFSIVLSGNLFSQEKGFGFTTGIDLVGLFYGDESPSASVVPTIYYISRTETAQIEPSLSYYSSSSDDDDGDVKRSQIGIGFGYLQPKYTSDNFTSYIGGRLLYSMISTKYSYSGDDYDDSQISIAPVYGAEYKFSNHFSVGGELRLNITLPSAEDESDTRTIYTSTALFFRFYK